MRWLLSIVGAVLILAGAVWILQGVNILPGSFMSGNPTYAGLGVVSAVVGIVILVWANRKPKVPHHGGD